MEKLIAEVKELHGDFILKGPNGKIEMLAVGAQVHEGDGIFGMKWNTAEHTLLLSVDGLSRDIVFHGEDSLFLDAATIAAASSVTGSDSTPFSTEALSGLYEATKEDDIEDTQASTVDEQPGIPHSEGISTSEFITHDDNADNVIAHLIETLNEPLMKDESLDFTTAQNIAGIVDFTSVIDDAAISTSQVTEQPDHKSVHQEVMQTAIDNADIDKSSYESAGTAFGVVPNTDESDTSTDEDETASDTFSTDYAFKIDFDEISSDIQQLQLAKDTEVIKELNIDDVLDITPTDISTLRIMSNGESAMELDLGAKEDADMTTWTKAAETLLGDDGNTYDIYTGTSSTETLTLQVDQNIIVTDFG